MADNTYKQNTYSSNGKKSWHSKGITGKIGVFETAEQVYGQMETVEYCMSEAFFNVNGRQIPSKLRGIFRVEGAKIIEIGSAKDRYVMKQPIDYIREFDTMGKPVETLGFLGANAEKLFITWNLPEIDIHGDAIEMYGFLSFGFDGKYGNHLFVTSTRVVCQNTHNIAIAEAGKTENHGRGKNSNNAVVTTKHNSDNHLETLGHWMRFVNSESEKQVEIIKNLFCTMKEKPVTVDEAFGLFNKTYFDGIKDARTFIPPELKDEEIKSVEERKAKAKENVDLAMSLFQGAGIAITPDVFGVYNCVTEHQNHHILSKKSDGVDSLLEGGRAKVMNTALRVCEEFVTVR